MSSFHARNIHIVIAIAILFLYDIYFRSHSDVTHFPLATFQFSSFHLQAHLKKKKSVRKSKYVLVCISVRKGFSRKCLHWNNQAILWLKEIALVEVFGVHLQIHSTAYFDSLWSLDFQD